MHDYDNDGFGGSQHTSNAFEQAKRDENDSYRNLPVSGAKDRLVKELSECLEEFLADKLESIKVQNRQTISYEDRMILTARALINQATV